GSADEAIAFSLQRTIQEMVDADTAKKAMARAAFQSFVRAYATRSADSKRIFQVRTLHLGHVARSFGLKDPPSAV
ncbi:unnamed protein product, partial [Phaeothamnion confervicola]